MNARKTLSLLPLLLVALTGPAWAQIAAAPPPPSDDQTIDSYSRDLRESASGRAAAAAESNVVQKIVPKEVAAKPTTATPPNAFSDRVLNSIADFLPLFQFAVNNVTASEDKMSVTAKFNPIPVGTFGNFSLTATASQPQLFSALEKQIVEPARDTQRKALLGQVDDFSDLTATLTYGYQKRAGSWEDTRKLFGRNYELYRSLASELLRRAILPALDATDDPTDRVSRERLAWERDHKQQLVKIPNALDDFGHVTFGTLRANLPAEAVNQLIAILNTESGISNDLTASVQKLLKENLLDTLPALIDNQPQATFQTSYRSSDDIIGPDTTAVTLGYEMGTRNFNSVLREYRRMKRDDEAHASPLAALRQVTESGSYRYEDKLIFNLSFRRNDDYLFDWKYQEAVSVPGQDQPTMVDRTARLSLPRSDQWKGSLTWTRLWPRRENDQARSQALAAAAAGTQLALPARQDPRITISLEREDNDQKKVNIDNVLQDLANDRWLAKASLVIPVQGAMTLPLTIVWANKPEFLKDQDRILSAHVGISYKIGDKGATQK
jgi:hypothetical protein